MRTELDIHAAHDRLVALIQHELPAELEPEGTEQKAALVGAINALCWVLDHEHNVQMQVLLNAIDAQMAARGLVLTRPNN
jgi:hypothetical protein